MFSVGEEDQPVRFAELVVDFASAVGSLFLAWSQLGWLMERGGGVAAGTSRDRAEGLSFPGRVAVLTPPVLATISFVFAKIVLRLGLDLGWRWDVRVGYDANDPLEAP